MIPPGHGRVHVRSALKEPSAAKVPPTTPLRHNLTSFDKVQGLRESRRESLCLREGVHVQHRDKPSACTHQTSCYQPSGYSGLSKRRISTCRSRVLSFSDLRVTEAILRVIVEHADSLHERIADGRSNEFEAASEQVAA